jgi:beta-glucosidase
MQNTRSLVRYPLRHTALLLFLFLGGFAAAVPAAAQAPTLDSPAIEAQAQTLLAKLTPEQKIELLGGIDSMYTRATPAIGLPRFKMSDASVGVRTWGPSTSYAGGVALAATWEDQPQPGLRRSEGRSETGRGEDLAGQLYALRL